MESSQSTVQKHKASSVIEVKGRFPAGTTSKTRGSKKDCVQGCEGHKLKGKLGSTASDRGNGSRLEVPISQPGITAQKSSLRR
jgi:hypothetical protein